MERNLQKGVGGYKKVLTISHNRLPVVYFLQISLLKNFLNIFEKTLR